MSMPTRSLLVDEVIRSDRHHRRFLHRDLSDLSEQEIWAERKVLEDELADRILRRDRSQVLGSELLTGDVRPVTQVDWIRSRLIALQREGRRRRLEGRTT